MARRYRYVDTANQREVTFRATDRVLVLPAPTVSYGDAALDLGETPPLWEPSAIETLWVPPATESRWSPLVEIRKRRAGRLQRRGKVVALAPLYRDEHDRGRAFLAGEVLVELKEGFSSAEFDRLLIHLKSRIVADHCDTRVFTLAARRGEEPFAAIERFQETGAFERVQPSEVAPSLAPERAGSRQRCRRLRDALRRSRRVVLGGPAGREPLLLAFHEPEDADRLDVLSLAFLCMGIDQAWRQVWGRNGLGPPGAGMTVALVDRPIFRNHPDLDVLDFDRATAHLPGPNDLLIEQRNHGTKMAGVAIARRNGLGALGAAPGARILPVVRNDIEIRINDRIDRLAEAIEYFRRNRIRRAILNFSWIIFDRSPDLERRIEEACRLGFLMMAAAGNDGDDLDRRPVFPACFSGVTTIGARRLRIERLNGSPELVCGRRLSGSNHGRDHVDLSAPGECFYTTHKDKHYALASETSPATAAVSGIAALLWSAFPKATGPQILQALRCTARPAPGGGLGVGWVHAADALRHLDREVSLVPRVGLGGKGRPSASRMGPVSEPGHSARSPARR